jgi:ankyrin repeat domain-containing protein 50
LHFSARDDKGGVLSTLLRHEASVEKVAGDWELRPMHIAASSGALRNLMELALSGADIDSDDKNEGTPLSFALSREGDQCVQFLLDKGANVERCDSLKSTILHRVTGCSLETVRIITEAYPIAVNAQNWRGSTPLHGFATGRLQTLKYILSIPGIQLSIQDREGNTPLHCAATWDSVENFDFLLRAGADMNIYNALL